MEIMEQYKLQGLCLCISSTVATVNISSTALLCQTIMRSIIVKALKTSLVSIPQNSETLQGDIRLIYRHQ